MSKKKALILIDLQNDFCPGGRLPVPEGDAVIAVANRLQAHFDEVIASQDWHPPQHVSFASSHPGAHPGETIFIQQLPQQLWPDHCIQGSLGAAFHPQLNTAKIHKIIYKGVDLAVDSYSAFFDNRRERSTGLADYLQAKGITDIYMMGLATDYCVKYSCQDALLLGFKVYLIEDGCRGVDLRPGDVARAWQEMQAAGAARVNSQSFA